MTTNFLSQNQDLTDLLVDKSGIPSSAQRLDSLRRITLTGDVSGTVLLDGSEDVTLPVTVTAPSVNMSGEGVISGIIDIDRIPPDALDKIYPVANSTARLNLSKNDVQNGDSVREVDTGKMYFVVDDTKLNSEDGYEPYSAGNLTSVTFADIVNLPETWNPEVHFHTLEEIDPGNMVSDRSVPYWNHTTGTWSLTHIMDVPAMNPIRQPTPTSITNGATGVSLTPTLTAENFVSMYGTTFGKAEWELCKEPTFTTSVIRVVSETLSTTCTEVLMGGTKYYVRVRYIDNEGNVGVWGEVSEFTTGTVVVEKPVAVSPANGATGITETPRLEGGAFNAVGNADSHVSTDWQIASDSGFVNVVWESLNDSVNKTSVVVAPGYLMDGSITYYWRLRYRGEVGGESAWSDTRAFTTIAEFQDVYAGIAEVFNSGKTYYTSITKLTDTKAIVAYRDESNSYYGTAVVLDINGTTITSGNEFVFNNGIVSYTSITKLTNTKAIVAYYDGNNSYGTAIVLDINGTTITSGNEYIFNNGGTDYPSITRLTDTKAIVAYRDVSNSSYGTAKVLDINGTVITSGNEFVFSSGGAQYTSITALTDTKAIVAYYDISNSDYGTAVVLDINGTSITSGNEYVFNSGGTYYNSITKLTDTKAIVAYSDGSNSYYGTAIVLDINGTSITKGDEFVFNSGDTGYTSITKLTDTKAIVAYQDGSNSYYGTAIVLDINGTSITSGNEFVFNNGNTNYTSITKLTDTKAIVAYRDGSNGSYGTAKILYS